MVQSGATISKFPVSNTITETQSKISSQFHSRTNQSEKVSVNKVVVGIPREINDEKIQRTLDEINKILEKQQLETSYQRHEATNRMVIRLVDKETKEIVKEIPPEKLLDYAASVDEALGLFIDKRA